MLFPLKESTLRCVNNHIHQSEGRERSVKAAVLHHFGGVPRYEDFPDPVPEKDELLVQVKME